MFPEHTVVYMAPWLFERGGSVCRNVERSCQFSKQENGRNERVHPTCRVLLPPQDRCNSSLVPCIRRPCVTRLPSPVSRHSMRTTRTRPRRLEMYWYLPHAARHAHHQDQPITKGYISCLVRKACGTKNSRLESGPATGPEEKTAMS